MEIERDTVKGEWVQISQIVLGPSKRAPQVPEDTKKVPFVLKVKGFLNNNANIGDIVTITTVIGRTFTGKLIAVNPEYNHSYGKPPHDLMNIGKELRGILNCVC